MSRPLPSVLSRPSEDPSKRLQDLGSHDATTMARRWLTSKHAPTKRFEAIAAVIAQLSDPNAVRAILARFGPKDRTVLEIVARHGGRVSGALFSAELAARGLSDKDQAAWGFRRRHHALCEHGLLHAEDRAYGFGNDEPSDVECPPAVVAVVTPANGVPWPMRPVSEPVDQLASRSPDVLALETLAVARACEALPKLDLVVGGALSAPTRKRLEKALGAQVDDGSERTPPARIDLAWAILRGLEAIDEDGPVVAVRVDRLSSLLAEAPVKIAHRLTRAWIEARHWQDGVGAVPENDRRDAIVRWGFDDMRALRELVTWALGRVALHPSTWLGVETFVHDLRPFVRQHGFHGPSPRLAVRFAAAEDADALPMGDARKLAYWLLGRGTLIANMLLVTLVHFGLVERGEISSGGPPRPEHARRWAFRLTEMGRQVFGAPDVAPLEIARPRQGDGVDVPRPLVVQGNFEILLHVDDADLAVRTMLARFATLISAGERVSRYRLDAPAIHGAVDAGMTADAIVAFLEGASRTALPKPVTVAIAEWCGGRETVRLHGPGVVIADERGARIAAGEELAQYLALRPERLPSRPTVAVLDEHGHATGDDLHPLVIARLARIADRSASGFTITRERVLAARATGVTAAQLEGWLAASVKHVPALFRARLAHWLTLSAPTTTTARTERHTFLRLDDEALEHAVASSAHFRALGVERIARGFLRIDEARLPEVTRELRELGVVVDAPGPALDEKGSPSASRSAPQRRGAR